MGGGTYQNSEGTDQYALVSVGHCVSQGLFGPLFAEYPNERVSILELTNHAFLRSIRRRQTTQKSSICELMK